jgi:hypothetical protein
MGNSGCCAVVRGTTILKIAVLLIATTTTPTTITTISGFGLCAVFERSSVPESMHGNVLSVPS